MAGRTPALQQNWQSWEKSQHFKEETQYLMNTLNIIFIHPSHQQLTTLKCSNEKVWLCPLWLGLADGTNKLDGALATNTNTQSKHVKEFSRNIQCKEDAVELFFLIHQKNLDQTISLVVWFDVSVIKHPNTCPNHSDFLETRTKIHRNKTHQQIKVQLWLMILTYI